VDPSLRLGIELPLPRAAEGLSRTTRWRDTLVADARAAEEAGAGAVWITAPTGAGSLDPATVAGAVSVRTATVRLGVGARIPGGRHPAVVARDVTALDVLSGGRAAVWLEADGAGPGQLAEALAVCRSVADGTRPELVGRFYEVHGAPNRPGPVHRLPLWAVPGEEHDPSPEDRAWLAHADAVVVGGPPGGTHLVAWRRLLDDLEVGLVWRGAVAPHQADAVVEALDGAGVDAVVARLAEVPDRASVELSDLVAVLAGRRAGR
jgi:hypothetical protein